jgi:basic membrane lipoprotein Med (substrate-binding protein (PBP1-ABC) superfamily)
VYSQFSACLLTDPDGVSGPLAQPVWAGMQAASLKTLRKVSYLPVSGPDTVANAESFVNTLVQRRCDLVVAVGDSEVAAAEARAKGFPSARFVVVGSGVADGNLAVIPVGPAEQVRSAVAQAVESAPES